MNWHHLAAFLWLTWRLRVNQIKRGGIANQIILGILAFKLALGVVALFIGCFILALVFKDAPPIAQLIFWDVVVFSFLMWWGIGLLADLQRSESLSLTKFLHLPVSLTGVFLLNYLASLFSVTLALTLPAMVGFSLGMVVSAGPLLLLLLPLVATFLLMVTALSYQFQGWLASLMADKRRRRTVIFIVTLVMVVVFQLPYLINLLRPWEQSEIKDALPHDPMDMEWKRAEEIGWYVNAALPIGWLPLGAMSLVEGNVVPALLGTLGMGLIGGASLWRAYRTTVQLYTGHYTGRAPPRTKVQTGAPSHPAPAAGAVPLGLLGLSIPWLSEPAAGIALASLRALTRAPEARMLLLSPIIMVFIFGGMYWRSSTELPMMARALPAIGAIGMILLSLMQLVGNQFGFDRGGFRVYILSPAPRRAILLGKNLGLMPAAFVLVLPLFAVVQFFSPMRLDHLLALFPQFVTMYLLYCLVANVLSIYAPLRMASGSMKAASTKLVPTLLHMAFGGAMPIALAPTMLPLGLECLLEWLEWSYGVPIYLILISAECAAVVWLYRRLIDWEGGLLQRREQAILETVTTKEE